MCVIVNRTQKVSRPTIANTLGLQYIQFGCFQRPLEKARAPRLPTL